MNNSRHDTHKRVNLQDIGVILKKINDCEISFRFENLVAVGYRWAVVGYPQGKDVYDIQLKRAEIDDVIDGATTIVAIDEFNRSIEEQHIQKRDWYERGIEYDDITIAINDLANAICRLYPDSEFTEWYLTNYQE